MRISVEGKDFLFKDGKIYDFELPANSAWQISHRRNLHSRKISNIRKLE